MEDLLFPFVQSGGETVILGMTVGFSLQVDVDTYFDLSSLPVPSLAWREIFSFSDDGSV